MNIIIRNIKIFYFLTFIFFVSISTNKIYAIEFQQLTTKNGLPNSYIHSIIQDGNGFMWFGTDNGLCRYDGLNCITFKDKITKRSLFHDTKIISLANWGKDTLIIGLSNGLAIFNTLSEEYNVYYYTENKTGNYILKVFVDNSKNIWVSTVNGLKQFDLKTNKFIEIERYNSLNPQDLIIFDICQDQEGHVWFAGLGNSLFYTHNNQIYSVIIPDEFIKESSFVVSSIISDQYNRIWIGTASNGVLIFNNYKNKWESLNSTKPLFKSKNIKSLFLDKIGNVWIGTDKQGLYFYSFGNISHYTYSPFDKESLSSNSIFSIYESSDGVIWFGTLSTGINLYKKHVRKFTPTFSLSNATNSNGNLSVLSIKELTNGEIIIGTDGDGLCRYNSQLSTLKKIHNSDFSTIESIVELDNKKIIAGTYRNGIILWDIKNINYSSQNKSFLPQNSTTRDLLIDLNGNIWYVCFQVGVFKENPKTGKISKYNHVNKNFETNFLRFIYEDFKGTIWAGVDGGGLYKYNVSKDIFEYFPVMVDGVDVLKNNNINDVFEDSNGLFWIGTDSKGIFCLKGNDRIFSHSFSIENGLPDNCICAILEDKFKNKWISTNYGLARINNKNNSIDVFYENDGLSSNEFNIRSKYKLTDGKLLFGSKNGLSLINPDNIFIYNYKAAIVSPEIKIITETGEEIIERNFNKTIIIPRNYVSIKISLASLDYNDPTSTQFKYILEDFDSKEIYTTYQDKKALYVNVPPGEYTFKAWGSNSDKVWNETPLIIKFSIEANFYKTGLFKTLLTIILLILIFGIAKIGIVFLRKNKKLYKTDLELKNKDLVECNTSMIQKIEYLETQNKNKDKFLAIIAQDLRNPLNILLGFTEFLNSNHNNIKQERLEKIYEATYSSTKLMHDILVNILDWSQIQNESIVMNIQRLNLYSIVDDGIESILSEAKNKEIKIDIRIKDDIYVFADLRMIQRILKNIFSYSVKFSRIKGTISIDAKSTSNEFVEIRIFDNGLGLTHEQMNNMFKIEKYRSVLGTERERGTGLGLIVCKEFIESHGGILKIESELGNGTSFIFYLPKQMN